MDRRPISKSANYLNFDHSRMVNLEYSLNREILRTNRRGAYHCTSIAECNTRKQHGLLVMPIPELGNTSHVLLSSFSETIIQYGAPFNMGINKYDGDNFSPHGHRYIREFTCDTVPKLVYRVGGVIFSKEKMFSLENNSILIRYTLLDAFSPTTIRFNPFLAYRDANSLTYENSTANHGYREEENGISVCMYHGYPRMYMQFSNPNAKFVFDPKWYKGIEYLKDQQEGLPYKEDLYVPGYFEMPIKKGDVVVFSASDTPTNVENLKADFESGISIRTPRSSFYNCLKNSAHQFYYKPQQGGTYILNGYPWGKVTAREELMALEGLTLSIGKEGVCEDVLDTAIPAIRDFMNGEEAKSLLQDLDEPDLPFWVMRVIGSLVLAKPEKYTQKYTPFIRELLDCILEDRYPRLKLMGNMLLHTDGKERPASWMNGVINGKPVVPRSGYLVEINALWYNSLRVYESILAETEEFERSEFVRDVAERAKSSFLDVFLNSAGYLYDYVDGNYADWTVRPNMLYAISSHYPILDRKASKQVLDFVTRELLMAKGVRTRSPKSGDFHPRYEGSREEKEYASLNGVARAWLLAPYLEAYIKVFKKSGIGFVDRILAGIESEMENDCIGSLSEMYDGNMPSLGHGMISSAVNVGGVLRVLKVRQELDQLIEETRK